MRLALAAFLVCSSALAQQPIGLTQFLALTGQQVASVRQLNDALSIFVQTKTTRKTAVQLELNAEYAKPNPDARALGERYIEIDSIDHEIAAERANAQAKVLALLIPAQAVLVQQISSAIVQQSLLRDASCAYLADAIPTVPGIVQIFDPAAGTVLRPNIVSIFPVIPCSLTFPVSIRNLLSLTDSQVSSILAVETAYTSLNTRNQNRVADIEVELRDETAKPTLNPSALGNRYAELASLSHQLQEADQEARKAARALLTVAQQAALQAVLDASALRSYLLPAESCHFLSVPPGTAQADISGFPCLLN